MNRSRHPVEPYYNRDISIHKPGVIPKSSSIISPITSNYHKYDLKQRLYTSKTIESWFANHSPQERRVVYSFIDTLYKDDQKNENKEQRQKSANPRLSHRINTAPNRSSQQRLSQSSHRDSQSSKRDLGEVVQSLESVRPSTSVQEKGVQTSSTVPLPDVNESKSETIQSENSSNNKSNINDRTSRRYLSQTWRVINPREDIEPSVRPDSNTSAFFQYTKKTFPEYYFIHPHWY